MKKKSILGKPFRIMRKISKDVRVGNPFAKRKTLFNHVYRKFDGLGY